MDHRKSKTEMMLKYFETVFYRPKSDIWSTEELERLCAGMENYGEDFDAISKYVVTKSKDEVS